MKHFVLGNLATTLQFSTLGLDHQRLGNNFGGVLIFHVAQSNAVNIQPVFLFSNNDHINRDFTVDRSHLPN